MRTICTISLWITLIGLPVACGDPAGLDSTPGPGSGAGDGSGDGTGSSPGGRYCTQTEEGYFCQDIESGGGGTGTGTGTTDGNCPEEGCPDDGTGSGGGSGGGTGSGGSGTGSGTTGGDCPEEGCPDGTGSGSGDGTGWTDPICYAEEFDTRYGASAEMLLVVDRSGSMDEETMNGGATKWQELGSVVTRVTGELDNEMGFGLMFYPAGSSQNQQCVAGSVAVDIGDHNGNAIASAFGATSPGGGTPTAATLHAAEAYLASTPSARPRAVILATDGAPNCNSSNNASTCVCSQQNNCGSAQTCLDDVATIASVEALEAAGVATFVVGIPGSELFSQVLDRMAVAGGTALGGSPRYYGTASEAALEEALRGIGLRIANCRFELQAEPLGATLEVSVDGILAPQDVFRSNGWDYVGARTVEFFGAYCEGLTQGTHTVAVEYCNLPES